MGTFYNAQINSKDGTYSIQFETSNRDYFKYVERACQRVLDERDKAVSKERCSRMSTMGHL